MLRVGGRKLCFVVLFRPRSERPVWGGGAKPSLVTLHSTPSARIPACVEGEQTHAVIGLFY